MNVPFVLDGTVGHYILVTVCMYSTVMYSLYKYKKVVHVYFDVLLREYKNSIV